MINLFENLVFDFLKYFLVSFFLWFNWVVFIDNFEDFWENLLTFLAVFYYFFMAFELFVHCGYFGLFN